MAGGLDTFDWLKDRTKRPSVVVDLSQVAELRGIKEVNGGLEIGAATPLTEVVKHPVVKEKFGILMEAAELVASPQIRNQGTLGGQHLAGHALLVLPQRLVVLPGGRQHLLRRHADGDQPGARDSGAGPLRGGESVGHGAGADCAGRGVGDSRACGGERVVKAEDYFVGPAIDIMRMTVLQPGELLTAIRIPATWAGAQFYFEKVRDRNVWDFPLVNVASAIKCQGNTIQRARIAVGAVAARPLRLTAVEAAVAGSRAAKRPRRWPGELAIEGATPLRYNGYKIPLMRNLVKRAIRGRGARDDLASRR